MILVRVMKSSLIGACAAAVLLLAVGSSTALARSAWWHVTSGTRPAYLDPGSERSEVQDVNVSATGGDFVLGRLSEYQFSHHELENAEGEPLYVELPYDATHQQVQASLEGLYGAGNVQVTGGGDPYQITFTGAFMDQPIELVNTAVTPKTPLVGTIHATQVSEGKPAGEIYITATNVGNRAIESEAVAEIKDTLPAGLTAVAIEATRPEVERSFNIRKPIPCSLPTLTCTLPEPAEEPLEPFYPLEERILVTATPSVTTGELNTVSVTGGGTPSVTIARPITVSAAEVPFGIEDYELTPEEEGGVPATQAGVHPFQLTTTFQLNQTADTTPNEPVRPTVAPAGLAKDLNFKFPAGLVGDPNAIQQCTATQFEEHPEEADTGCPEQSAIGVAVVTVKEPSTFGVVTLAEPLFNMEPRVGEPARFAFFVPIVNIPVYLDTSVRTGSDYGVTISVDNITEETALISSEVTVWGVPGDPRHNLQRGWGCLLEESSYEPHPPCESAQAKHPPAFLQMPTSCTGALQSTLEGDSWEERRPAGEQVFHLTEPLPAQDGCNRLPFEPSLTVTPDGTAGSTPTGLTVDVHNPQEGSLAAGGLAEPDVKNITVALPEGVSINPAGADGLQACSTTQVGYLPPASSPPEDLMFTSTLTQPFCPTASKIGTAKIKTPLLPNPLEGAVYLATQDENPFGSLVAMYIVVEDPVSGVLVKLAGDVHLSESGHIVASFDNNPQLPFEDAELHFFGGERAPLATPAHCGAYTTTASFSPWTGNAPATPTSTFDVTSGPNGSACPGSALPFSPSLTAGTTSNQAGGFSPFTMTMSREDGNQNLQAVQLHMPSGLEGVLSSVALCGEAQADAGTCGAESEIGETTVSVGLGGDPFSVKGGRVYITGPYDGAPFGLSIVNPAVAGPFNLGNVVVRAKIEVDPRTAELTITTDASGEYAIPTILDGIPLEIKHINVIINRPDFTFNPTNCEKTEVGGSLSSAEGASQALAVSFQPTNCAVLRFQPKFSTATAAKASKAKGASLLFKLSYPKGAMGSEAWFNEAKFDIPKQLPARLSTIQQACDATTFETNRVACPKHSIIGSATVHTPILPVPLEGPVYFVSYGGAKFPDAVLVLKGYGLTIELHGNTFINGTTGVTSATFKSLPDVPFESIEVNLPAGEYSEFGANLPAKAHFDFCGQKLTMPTIFKASNGAQIKQNTPVTITSCTKATKKKTKKKHKTKAHKSNTHKK
jgi:hypothetical protein